MNFCSVDRIDPAHPRATGDCSPDVQGSLDSPGLSGLPGSERRAALLASRGGAVTEEVRDLVARRTIHGR